MDQRSPLAGLEPRSGARPSRHHTRDPVQLGERVRRLNVPAAGSGGRLPLTPPVKPELTAALTVMNDRLAQGAASLSTGRARTVKACARRPSSWCYPDNGCRGNCFCPLLSSEPFKLK